jgi:hypothetical protein
LAQLFSGFSHNAVCPPAAVTDGAFVAGEAVGNLHPELMPFVPFVERIDVARNRPAFTGSVWSDTVVSNDSVMRRSLAAWYLGSTFGSGGIAGSTAGGG